MDVKRKEIEIGIKGLKEGIDGLRRAKIKAQVSGEQIGRQAQPQEEKLASMDAALKTLRGHLEAAKPVEIAGKTYSPQEIQEMTDRVLQARKATAAQVEAFHESQARLQKVVSTLERKQQDASEPADSNRRAACGDRLQPDRPHGHAAVGRGDGGVMGAWRKAWTTSKERSMICSPMSKSNCGARMQSGLRRKRPPRKLTPSRPRWLDSRTRTISSPRSTRSSASEDVGHWVRRGHSHGAPPFFGGGPMRTCMLSSWPCCSARARGAADEHPHRLAVDVLGQGFLPVVGFLVVCGLILLTTLMSIGSFVPKLNRMRSTDDQDGYHLGHGGASRGWSLAPDVAAHYKRRSVHPLAPVALRRLDCEDRLGRLLALHPSRMSSLPGYDQPRQGEDGAGSPLFLRHLA